MGRGCGNNAVPSSPLCMCIVCCLSLPSQSNQLMFLIYQCKISLSKGGIGVSRSWGGLSMWTGALENDPDGCRVRFILVYLQSSVMQELTVRCWVLHPEHGDQPCPSRSGMCSSSETCRSRMECSMEMFLACWSLAGIKNWVRFFPLGKVNLWGLWGHK